MTKKQLRSDSDANFGDIDTRYSERSTSSRQVYRLAKRFSIRMSSTEWLQVLLMERVRIGIFFNHRFRTKTQALYALCKSMGLRPRTYVCPPSATNFRPLEFRTFQALSTLFAPSKFHRYLSYLQISCYSRHLHLHTDKD